MDLSKAFDVLDHRILIQIIEHYVFRGKFRDLLVSFISNRKYFVRANGLNSDIKTTHIGVPQGSTISPLLLLLYINDMKNASSLLDFIQFADDTTLTMSGPQLDILTKVIEEDFGKVLDWLLANRLIIKLSKTHSMLFANKKVERNIIINANNTVLEQKSECKFLGIMTDDEIN